MREAKQIIAIDVPPTATAEEAEAALNEPCETGYYVLTISPLLHGGVRAYFGKRREPKAPEGAATGAANRSGRAAI